MNENIYVYVLVRWNKKLQKERRAQRFDRNMERTREDLNM